MNLHYRNNHPVMSGHETYSVRIRTAAYDWCAHEYRVLQNEGNKGQKGKDEAEGRGQKGKDEAEALTYVYAGMALSKNYRYRAIERWNNGA